MLNHVLLYNSLLRLNVTLLRILIILCECKFYDVLFVINNDKVRVNFKGNKHSYEIYEELFGKYETIYIQMSVYQKMIHDIQLETNLNIFKNIPQTSSFKIMLNQKLYYIRASLHTTNYNIYALSLRLIQPIHNKIPSINLISSGLLLIGGRTCSGKTSLMYNILYKLSQSQQTILTLEDPIEQNLENITQTDVRYLGYDEGIRSILRQNPDWICIGEIRDSISAAAVIRAAMTGHNVIATIHIQDDNTESIINRFEEMKCKYLLSVLSQFIYCSRQNDKFIYIDKKL